MNYLSEYAMFDSVKAMDEAIAEHIQRNQYELNETDRDVLMMLSRYSVKYKGAAHLKVATIADIIGKSEITVRRSLKKLSKLNIIEKVTFMREKSGGTGANIYVIIPNDRAEMIDREEGEKPTQASDEDTDKQDETINLSSKNNNTLLDTEKGEPSKPSADEVIKRGLKHAMPAPIYKALAPFFDGQALYDTYGILLRAKAKIDRSIRLEEYGSRYIDAFYNVVRLYKAGKVRSLNGLLYAAWQQVTGEISCKIAYLSDKNNPLRLFEEVVFEG